MRNQAHIYDTWIMTEDRERDYDKYAAETEDPLSYDEWLGSKAHDDAFYSYYWSFFED